MSNPDDGTIRDILDKSKTIAVVGISNKQERDSYRVALYLHNNGYRIIPVNPVIDEWNGIRAYASLEEIPEPVDIVDVFRKPDAVMPVAEEAVRKKAQVIWLQEGVVNSEAADYASSHGLTVIMDRCIMKEHHRLH